MNSSLFNPDLEAAAQSLLNNFAQHGRMFASAESCTGGLITAVLTAIPGSSAVVERGFVTYTNEAKHEMLGVPSPLFESDGAVSGVVAEAMAQGALENSGADISVSVTGVAGPGASERKPAGLVFIATAKRMPDGTISVLQATRFQFQGDRTEVRIQSALAALHMATKLVDELGRD